MFAEHLGLSLSTVGRKAANHGAFFIRLESGRTITEARKDRVFQWFSDHWPEGLDWPPGIPRPEPSSDLEEAA